jgi:hypothetical protein
LGCVVMRDLLDRDVTTQARKSAHRMLVEIGGKQDGLCGVGEVLLARQSSRHVARG